VFRVPCPVESKEWHVLTGSNPQRASWTLKLPPYTLRRDGKSAEAIEKETPRELPLRKRVRNRVKTREFIEWDFFVEWLERSLAPSGRSGQTPFAGYEERSFDSLPSLRTEILIGFLVNHNNPRPPVFCKCGI